MERYDEGRRKWEIKSGEKGKSRMKWWNAKK